MGARHNSPPALTSHKKEDGLFRLNINLLTGVVTEVKVLRSTGVKILDDSAAVAFLQWKAKPHVIDHAIIPVHFVGVRGSTGSHINGFCDYSQEARRPTKALCLLLVLATASADLLAR